MVLDFTAMHPNTIIASAEIFPESIDIESSMYQNICRFDTVTVYITSTNGTDGVFMGACVVGSDEASSE